jgi:spore coat protein H
MRIALLISLFLLLGACSDPSGSSGGLEDSTGTTDGGPPEVPPPPSLPEPDASTPDAGTPPDAGTSPDVGTSPDAGTSPPARPSAEAPRWPPLQTSIPTYELTLSEEDLAALHAHAGAPPSQKLLVPGRFTHEGRTWEVRLRFRGRSTKTDPRIVKKSWQVRFESEDRFQGVKRLELLAAWKDAGYLTEKLWYDVAASVGLRVPRARYVHLKVNGTYMGVFTELESITKDFLRAHDFDRGGDIYRCGMHDCEMRQPPREPYMEDWDKRTNEKEPQPFARLWSFLEHVNRTPPHRFGDFVEARLELEDYLTWMALDAFIANDIQGDSRSFLIHDRETGKWTYVPWDLNNALSLYNRTNPPIQGVKKSHPLFSYTAYDPQVYELFEFRRDVLGYAEMKPTWSTLSTRILDDPGLRARLGERLRILLEGWLTEENLGPRIDAMHALLAPFILPGPDGTTVDPYVSVPHAERSAGYLRLFVRERRAWLLGQLPSIDALGGGPLVIDRVGREDSGAFWVQLYNRGSEPVSLEGLFLSGFTRVPTGWRLPALTVPPGQFVTFHEGAPGLQGLGAVLNPERPELSLFAADGKTAVDLLWLAPLRAGETYGRQPRGAEPFGPQPGP